MQRAGFKIACIVALIFAGPADSMVEQYQPPVGPLVQLPVNIMQPLNALTSTPVMQGANATTTPSYLPTQWQAGTSSFTTTSARLVSTVTQAALSTTAISVG